MTSYFSRKPKEGPVPLSQRELEERSDEALQEPWWAPRVDYGAYLDWKERQAREFAANPSKECAEAAERNRKHLEQMDLDPEPWVAWNKKYG